MTDYVVPTGVRVADADRVRLGAYLGEGATVMHEGFVNFNAGALGKSMIEGRVSAGVTADDGSDVGGGASLMGTLSGGGSMVIRVGQGSLLGANSGCGIPLGDGCTVEAGLYVTAGTKFSLSDGRVVKARELAGHDDLLFRRNSLSGVVERRITLCSTPSCTRTEPAGVAGALRLLAGYAQPPCGGCPTIEPEPQAAARRG